MKNAAAGRQGLTSMLLACLLAACAARPAARPAADPAPAAIRSLTWLGTATLARTATGVLQHFGGISGIDRDPATDTWYLLSDDRSEHAAARFYTARIALGAGGIRHIDIEASVTLRQADGSAYPTPERGGDVPDPEAIRIDPLNGELVWSSEGDRRLGVNPWVRRSGRAGEARGEWRLPPNLTVRPGRELGARSNLSLEGLAFAPDGQSLWMAMETALIEDGPVASAGHGALARFTRVARDGDVIAQYVYPVGAIPVEGTGGKRRSDNGVSEVLAYGANTLLVVERSGHEVGDQLFEFEVRIFEAKIGRATDVAALASLVGTAWVPMTKRLLLDLNRAGIGRVDNIEAAAWGPRLADGRATLVLAADDNFAPNQLNQFIVFAVDER